MASIRQDRPIGKVLRRSAPPPVTLGTLNVGGTKVEVPSKQAFWVQVTLNSQLLPTSSNLVDKEQPISARVDFVIYHQPNPYALQYLSLEPLQLDISEFIQSSHHTKTQKSHTNGDVPEQGSTKADLFAANSDADSVRESPNMDEVLEKINVAYFLEKEMRKQCRQHNSTFGLGGLKYTADDTYQNMSQSNGDIIQLTAGKLDFLRPLSDPLEHVALGVWFLVRLCIDIVLCILNTRFPSFVLNGVAVKDLSAAAQQIDLRLQQFCFWPSQYKLLRKKAWKATTITKAQYISFYNSMWLVANDIIIGMALGSFLIHNNQLVAGWIHSNLDYYTVDLLQSMIVWLMGWPAGLKLNSELDSFLGELFLWLIRLWTVCIVNVKPFTPSIMVAIGMCGHVGASMIFALLSDYLAFMTLHVYWFYMVAARIFNWQATILYSLFNLFRGKCHDQHIHEPKLTVSLLGKKRNMLRHRIDSCDYDLDQLLLGTILFTLLGFLFPTIIVYYLTFAASRVALTVLQAKLETILAFLNHFPLFAIMLRFKDPGRLPGGIQLSICPTTQFSYRKISLYRWYAQISHFSAKQPAARPTITPSLPHKDRNNANRDGKTPALYHTTANSPNYLYLKNLPIPFSAIFFQYLLLWKRLSAHYFSSYVFRCLLYGEPIRPIPRLQYPMLPEWRPSTSYLWRNAKETLLGSRAHAINGQIYTELNQKL
ncbi:hypothetical protein BZG36_05196 [Bifiguratus adelaidae]|uniref:Uncharacterized protein n=1 Tax=Bifiguratus adelaidae TaxID=1938954 RepID=A0A261XVB5_9FUNG|nr:hypothetical protein BZG36_05196 [Bifiguratus adelaidae]